MEQVLQGWLVKSPPEKKSFGTWKIFGAVNFRFEFQLDASVNRVRLKDADNADEGN